MSKHINKVFSFSTVIITVLLISNQSFAATLNIKGVISSNCLLNSVTTNANWDQLPIEVGGSLSVATANITCNYQPGYIIKASSLNKGLLVNELSPYNSTPYSITMGGTGSTGAQSLTVEKELIHQANLAAPLNSDGRNIGVNVTAVTTPWPGTYSDTITITLTSL